MPQQCQPLCRSKGGGRQEQLAYAHPTNTSRFLGSTCGPLPAWALSTRLAPGAGMPRTVGRPSPCSLQRPMYIPEHPWWWALRWVLLEAEDELGSPRALVVLFLGCTASTLMHPARGAGTGRRHTSWGLGGCKSRPPSSLWPNIPVQKLSCVWLIPPVDRAHLHHQTSVPTPGAHPLLGPLITQGTV